MYILFVCFLNEWSSKGIITHLCIIYSCTTGANCSLYSCSYSRSIFYSLFLWYDSMFALIPWVWQLCPPSLNNTKKWAHSPVHTECCSTEAAVGGAIMLASLESCGCIWTGCGGGEQGQETTLNSRLMFFPHKYAWTYFIMIRIVNWLSLEGILWLQSC